jgi:hypothetical protein
VSKTDATFEAACAKHIATSFAGHALEETVLASAVTFFGLVGSFRHALNFLGHRFVEEK